MLRGIVWLLHSTAFEGKDMKTSYSKINPMWFGDDHKRRPQLGRRGVCPVRPLCGQGEGGVFQMRTSALFGAKNFGFFEIYGVSARAGGLSQCGHFSDKGVNFFAILCGRPLWTAPFHVWLTSPDFFRGEKSI